MTPLYIGLALWAVVTIVPALYVCYTEGVFEAALVGMVGFILGIFLVIPFETFAYAHYNERTLTCTVVDKDRGGDSNDMRVYTEQCGTLSNIDSYWRGKTTSADVWAAIEDDRTYTFTVAGWRNGFMSDFPNILEVEESRIK